MPNTLSTPVVAALFFWIICTNPSISHAEIFGDGLFDNGIEDGRLSLATTENAHYQRFLGTIECGGRIRGTGVLLNPQTADFSANHPVLLTARHVLPGVLSSEVSDDAYEMDGSLCSYQPAGVKWSEQPVIGRSILGSRFADKSQSDEDSIAEHFSHDWVVFALDSWPNWTNNAVSFSVESSSASDARIHDASSAFFVGYDGVTLDFKIDNRCQFGLLRGEQILANASGLVWDDCDSVAGSSGGVLFEQRGEQVDVAAIRVGSLFDEIQYPDGPNPGDKFDRQMNLNVARLVDDEIRNAIRELLTLPSGVKD